VSGGYGGGGGAGEGPWFFGSPSISVDMKAGDVLLYSCSGNPPNPTGNVTAPVACFPFTSYIVTANADTTCVVTGDVCGDPQVLAHLIKGGFHP